MILIDGASTQSRGRRPLPAARGAVRAITLHTCGVYERVDFICLPGRDYTADLLSWVMGQAGLLWGMSPDVGELFGLTFQDMFQAHGSYGHAVECDLSDLLADIFKPYIRGGRVGVRFFQSGGEACAAAARLARAWTHRDGIATQGYHGAALDFAHPPQSAGQRFALEHHDRFDFGEIQFAALCATMDACLMLEVPSVDEQVASDFLRECRAITDKEDIPLIIDDVVGGFRFALGGTCERYGVQADMICLGKAMSALGGVSALVGRYDIMDHLADDVFYSTTFGGSPGPLRVALESINWLRLHQTEVYGPNGHLQYIGRDLMDGLHSIGVPVVGQPERSALNFPTDEAWLDFCQRMISKGIMMHRPNFVTLAHTRKHVTQTVTAAREIVKDMGLSGKERTTP